MADYKRKKVKKIRIKKEQRSPARQPELITMRREFPPKRTKHKKLEPAPQKQKKPIVQEQWPKISKNKSPRQFKVVNGFKKKFRIKTAVIGAASMILIIAILIISYCVPVSLTEAVENAVAKIGSDPGFPASLSGSKTIDARTVGNLTYILSDSSVDIFNANGKHIRSINHGMTSPAISVSQGRSIVYDIGGKSYIVFNLSEIIFSGNAKHEIISASIARSGSIALSTKSTKYTSQVEILNKNLKSIYVWYCSAGTIVDAALSSNGKKLAVSTLSVSNGAFKSEVSIFDFSSATPTFSYSYDQAVFSLETVDSSVFSVVTESGLDFYRFDGKKPQKHKFDYRISIFRSEYSGYSAVAVCRAGNKTENSIIIYGSKGNEVSTVNFKETLIDFTVGEKKVFCLTESEIVVIDYSGKVEYRLPCSFGSTRLSHVSNGRICSINDNKIESYKF